jgi:hypothetical protein
MQYHNMLKQKHEAEQKAASDQAAKKRALEDKVTEAKSAEDAEKNRLKQAEEVAQDLLKAEEREKESKTAFSGGGVKKGFLDGKAKKKK